MRILPIAITAAFLALPMQMDVVVKESTALAKGVARPGFGDHERPWAADLAAGRTMPPPGPDPADGNGTENAAANGAETPANAQTPGTALANEGEALCTAGTDDEARRRQARLQAAEKRVERQIGELTALRGAIESLLARQEEAEKRDLQQLVNLYRNMKPKEAALILEDMDLPIVVAVVLAMKERDAAPILAHMPKAAAQNVTREIARRKSLERLNVSGL